MSVKLKDGGDVMGRDIWGRTVSNQCKSVSFLIKRALVLTGLAYWRS